MYPVQLAHVGVLSVASLAISMECKKPRSAHAFPVIAPPSLSGKKHDENEASSLSAAQSLISENILQCFM